MEGSGNMNRRWAGPAAVLATMCVAVAGCGSDSGSSSSGGTSGSGASKPTGVDKQAAAAVPQSYKSKGTLTVATDPSYAPNEFVGTSGSRIEGMDIDLSNAIGAAMGMKVTVQKATFDAIIPGLAAKKYDLGVSSFTDTKEREQTVDFVTYFSAGTSFYVKAQGGPNVTGLSSLCGHTIATERGTTQAADAAKQAKKCGGNTKSLVFPDQNGANLAISSGRADVGMADSPVAAYQVKQSNGQFKLTGQPYGTAPYGIAVPKGSGLTKPIKLALQALDSSGKYMAILKKWGVQDGAITNFQVNGATS
jgi:polar amino acid transport system substrate-binding protein